MGLFGGSSKTTTTVTPSKEVEDILKSVVSQSNTLSNNASFTPYELAQMNTAQQGALAQLAASPELQQASQLLSGQTQQGLDTLGNANSIYNQIANSSVGADGINDFRNALTGANSLSSKATAQGNSAGGAVSNLGNSAALRSAGRLNSANNSALTQNQRSQQAAGIGASTLLNNAGYGNSVAGLQSNLGNASLQLGNQGVQLGQQAIQNQLQAGNQQQQYNQLQNDTAWQNAMGASQFDWNKINNQLNVLNSVSPMAGYTTTSTTPGVSKSQQLLGAGLSGLGTFGSLGGFSGGLLNKSTAAAQPGGGPTQPGATNTSYGGALGGLANWASSFF